MTHEKINLLDALVGNLNDADSLHHLIRNQLDEGTLKVRITTA